MDNYKSLLMETISKEDLVSKPAKIKRAGKLKEDLLPDEVYDTLVRKSKKTYTVGVYSTLPGPGWHYEINTEYGVYAKVPDDEGFIAHWFLQGLPQESEEKMENMAHYLIDEYDCKEVSLDEYKRIVNGKDESLKINRSKLLKESVTESDIAYAKEQAKIIYKKSLIDLDNRKIVIPFGIPKGDSYEEVANEIMSKGYIGHKFEEMGFNVSLSLGDFEYTTNGEFNPRSMIKYNGHKAYLRNRLIMTLTWDDIDESLTEDTVKTSDGKWTNKGKEGTHGKFKTKKAADAQRKAMFANGYHESLKERYADDAVVLTAPLRKKLNKICQKYSGFRLPEQIAPMWKELYDLGIEVLIQGYPTDTAPGAKSWTVPFTLNGETVENSRFVYSVYEGSEGRRNDYNMYFS